MNEKTRIVIIGGGFAGTATALNLEKTYRRDPSVEITLIDSENFSLSRRFLLGCRRDRSNPRTLCFH